MTRTQLAVIHLAKKQLRFDDDVYRAILRLHGGVDSAKQLDAAGFNRVMAYFTAQGFRSTWTKRTFGERPGMATAPQVDMIRGLWRQFNDSGDERALDRWLERSFKVSALRFLPPNSAQKAITGLRRMVARKPAGGEDSGGQPSPAA